MSPVPPVPKPFRMGLVAIWQKGGWQFRFWLMALAVGILSGFAAVGFRKGITAFQGWVYGAQDVHYLHSFAASMPW